MGKLVKKSRLFALLSWILSFLLFFSPLLNASNAFAATPNSTHQPGFSFKVFYADASRKAASLYRFLFWQLEKKALLAKAKDNPVEKTLALIGINANLDVPPQSVNLRTSAKKRLIQADSITDKKIPPGSSSRKPSPGDSPTASVPTELLPKEIKDKIVGKELIGKRTENSKTYEKPDGTYITLFSHVPLHFQENGKWIEIDKNFEYRLEAAQDDPALKNATHSTFSSTLPAKPSIPSQEVYIIKDAPYNLVIGKNLNQPVRFKTLNKQIIFKYQNTNPVQATVEGNKAFYGGAFQDTDIERYAINEGLKENIILKSSSAPLSFTEDIETPLQVILDDPDGTSSLIFSDDTSPVVISPHPVASDATGRIRYLKWDLESKGGKSSLTMTLDPTDLVYPVVIDPTVAIYNNNAAENTYVQSNYPSTVSWNQRALWVGYENGYYTNGNAKGYTRSFLQFPNLNTAIPAGMPVNGASLYLYKYAGPRLMSQFDSGLRAISVYDVDSAWNGTNTTWNTMANGSPKIGSYRGFQSLTSAHGYYNWNIQPLVQEWVDRSHTNYGMCLTMALEGDTCDVFRQAYTEYGNYPYLFVDWGESTPPKIAITSPVNASQKRTFETSQTSINFSIYATDRGGLSSIYWQSTGNSVNKSWTNTGLAPGGAANFSGNYKITTGMIGGPVEVESTRNVVSSQRVIYNNSFNEVMGVREEDLGTKFYFPWYDYQSVGMNGNWILIGNPSETATASCQIFIGDTLMQNYSIPPKGNVTPYFQGVMNGPVEVRSTNGVPVFCSQRVLYKDSFNEVMGTRSEDLGTKYYFPWYDYQSLGMNGNWILIGNPSAVSTAQCDIFIGGAFYAAYTIPPKGRVTPTYPGVMNGPVEVRSTNGVPVFCSQRVLYKDSFNEVMGTRSEDLGTKYYFPWYDGIDMTTWILVGNPSAYTANVDFYMGTTKMGNASIPPGGRVTPTYSGTRGGPVEVRSTNGVKVFCSQRALYLNSFDEVMGTREEDLAKKYYFPWYDSASLGMKNWVLVSNPLTASGPANVNIILASDKRASGSVTPGTTWVPELGALTGHNRVYFGAYDTSGNFGYYNNDTTSASWLDVSVDTKPPQTSLVISGTKGINDWYTTEPRLTLSPQDVGSGVQGSYHNCPPENSAVDDYYSAGVQSTSLTNTHRPFSGPTATYKYDKTTYTIPEGYSDFSYFSRDKVGNVESAKTQSFKVDSTSPSAPGPVSPDFDFKTNNPTTTFQWNPSAIETGSGLYRYALEVTGTCYGYDSKKGTNSTKPCSFTIFAQNTSYAYNFSAGLPRDFTPYYWNLSWSVKAQDNAGNYSSSLAARRLYIDVIAPNKPTMLPEPAFTLDTSQNTVSWSETTDTGVGGILYKAQCSANPTFAGNQETIYISAISYTFGNLENEKTYYYRVKAKDAAGNESAWSDAVSSTQDWTSPVIKNLEVSDDCFSPKISQGIQDNTTITATVLENHLKETSVTVLDSSGACVLNHTIPNSGSASQTVVSFVWNGKNQNGDYVPDGSYQIYFQAKDKAGSLSAIMNDTVWVDNQEPVLKITTPLPVSAGAYSYIAKDSTLTLEGTLSDTSTISHFTIYGSETSIGSDNSFNREITLTQKTTLVEIKAIDSAGNEAKITLSVTLDIFAPVISDPVPTGKTNDPKPAISAAYSDYEGEFSIDTASVRVYIDEQDITAECAISQSAFSYVPDETLVAGDHTVRLKVQDLAGNGAELTWSFQEDLSTWVSLFTPSDQDRLNQTLVDVSGRTEEGNIVNLFVNGNPVDSITAPDGNFAYSDVSLTDLAENIITAEAIDPLGNTASTSIAVHVDTSKPSVSATCVPNPFSPNSDDHLDLTTFDLSAVDTASEDPGIQNWALTIKDSGETTVKSFSGLGYPPDMLTWNGKNDDGALLVDGDYFYSLSVTSFTDAISTSSTKKVAIDTHAPAAPIIISPDSPTYTNQVSIEARGVAEPNSAVTILNSGEIKGGARADEIGNFRVTCPLDSGENIITAKATDSAGNESESSDPAVTVFVRVTKPLKEIQISPTLVNGGKKVDLWASTYSETLWTRALMPDGQEISLICETTPALNDIDWQWRGAWTVTPAAPAGITAVSFTAYDVFNNLGEGKTSLVIDLKAPPAPTIESPLSPTGAVDVKTAEVVITGRAEVYSTITLYDGEQKTTGETTANANGLWNVTLDLADGSHPVRAKATDQAGNTSGFSNQITLNVDSQSPAIAAQATPSYIPAGRPLALVAECSADVVQVIVTVPNDSGELRLNLVFNPETGRWERNYTVPDLPDGRYTAVFTALDAATNQTEAEIDFVIDSTPPAPPAVLYPPDDFYTNQNETTIAGQAETSSIVNIYVDGDKIATAPVVSSELWPFSSGFFAKIPLAENKTFDIKLTVSDLAGNESSGTVIRVTRDTIAPAPPGLIWPPDTGLLTNQRDTTVSGKTEDKALVSIYLNGEEMTSFATLNGFFAFHPITLVDEGDNTITVTATDRAGNTGDPAVRIVTLDVTPPDPPQIDIPSFTNQRYIPIYGQAEPYSTVRVNVNGSSAGCDETSADGQWELYQTVELTEEGTNTVSAAATDRAGNESETTEKTVVKDSTPPEPPVITSVDSMLICPLVIVEGTAEPHSTVYLYLNINDPTPRSASTSSDGHFIFSDLRLELGKSYSLFASAQDRAGNTSDPSAPKKVLYYQVAEGDTLQDLAAYYYSDASRWTEIRDFNHLNSDSLCTGWYILIPDPLVEGLYSTYVDVLTDVTTQYLLSVLSMMSPCAFGLEPVNTSIGNFTYSHRDVYITGKGLPMELTRSYNSLDPGRSRFGRGWNFSYNDRLIFYPDTTVCVIGADGRRAFYKSNPDGTYRAPKGVFDTLTKNEDGTFTLKKKDKTTLTFNPLGFLTEIADGNGNRTSLTCDDAGLLTKVTDSSGRSLDFTYDTRRRVTKVTDPAGREVIYGYDDQDNLISITNPNGFTTTYTYDDNHHLVSLIEAEGNQFFHNTYDGQGRVIKQTYGEAEGSFDYDTENRRTTVTDFRGHTSTYHYDERFWLTRQQDTLGNTAEYKYDDRGDLTKFTDKNGEATSFTYDDRGNQTSMTDALGNTTNYVYDEKDDLIEVRAPEDRTLTMDYDDKGNLLALTNPKGNTSFFQYDDVGQLTTFIDAKGNRTTFTYDDYKDVTKVTDPRAAERVFTYDLTGRKLSETDAKGNTTQFEYDANGNLVTLINPLNQTLTYAYDKNGNQVQFTDANGNVTAYGYDSKNNLISVHNALQDFQISYDGNDNRVSIRDPNGGLSRYEYDPVNRLIASIDPLGNTWQYGYDSSGNRVSATDANGNTTTSTYDAKNRLAETKDAQGGQTSYAYDALDNLLSVTDPLGAKTSYDYDAGSLLTRITDAAGGQTGLGYDELGRITALADANGHAYHFEYDSAGNLTRLTDPKGNSTELEYDLSNNKTKVTNAKGKATSYAYDELSRLTKQTDAKGAITNYAYDGNGNQTKLTDAKGNATEYRYDAVNRLIEVIDALGHATQYTYDGLGNKTSVTDANGHATTYEYDAAGRLTKMTDPLQAVIQFEHDANGNRTARTDANGARTAYQYDELNRLIATLYPDGSSVNNSYDPLGRKTSMVDAHGTTSYQYDALSRLFKVTEATGKEISYTYDKVGNRTSLTYPGGSKVDYLYDELNRLTEATDWKGRKTTYSYDELGNRTKTSLPNGVVTDYVYDEMNRVTAINSVDDKGKGLVQFGYTYDALGNKTSENKNGKSTSYEYDALSQLIKVMPETGKQSSPVTTEGIENNCNGTSYTYDNVGNRLTRNEINASSLLTTNYEYNNADELLKVAEHNGKTTSFEYDQNGNRVRQTRLDPETSEQKVATYTYDWENRLEEVVSYTGKVTTFSYDGEGNRIRKATRSPENAEPLAKDVTEYVWDRTPRLPDGRLCPQVLQTYDGAGELQSSFLYGKERIADVKEANTNYFMLDELGSVMALTDEKGNVVSHYDYDEFGVPLPFDNLNKGGNRLSNIFGYTGEEYDEELGLLNLRARNYEPEIGRFLQRDPYEVHMFTGLNKYVYVSNNPLGWIDPLGMVMMRNGGGDGGPPPEGYHREYYYDEYGNRVYTLLPNEDTSSPTWRSAECLGKVIAWPYLLILRNFPSLLFIEGARQLIFGNLLFGAIAIAAGFPAQEALTSPELEPLWEEFNVPNIWEEIIDPIILQWMRCPHYPFD